MDYFGIGLDLRRLPRMPRPLRHLVSFDKDFGQDLVGLKFKIEFDKCLSPIWTGSAFATDC